MHLTQPTGPTTAADSTASAPSLRVIGCAAGMPRPGCPSSGYLVSTGRGELLLDCGPGVAGVAASRPLVGVAISHLHADHVHDLLVLGKALTYQSRDRRLPLLLPPGGAAVIRAMNGLVRLAPDGPSAHATDRVLDAVFEVHELCDGQPVDLGPAVLTPTLLAHRQPNHGVRVELVESGATIAYSGDTGDTDALTRLAEGVDLLLAEATLDEPDTTGHGHLTAGQAGAHATAAGVGRLVLTHFPTDDAVWLDAQRAAAAAAYDGPIDIARPDSTHLLT